MNSYSKKLNDGRYVYYSWDEASKAEIPHYLVPGENGVTKDMIVTLAGFDHDDALLERYAKENADYSYSNYLSRTERGEEEARNPVDEQACRKWMAASDTRDSPDKTDLVRSLMESLTEDQRNLVYEIFGEQHTQKEIARRSGRVPQAINNRLCKIKARMKKLLAERGITR